VLSDALRNYIISHTSGVFESSYQTRYIREDLTKLAFKYIARGNDAIFRLLRNTSLSRDPGAPTDPTEKDLLKFEQRRDVSSLRAEIKVEKSAGRGDRKSLNPRVIKLCNLVDTLLSLRVKKKRKQYFKKVDRLRSSSLPTEEYIASIRASVKSSTSNSRLRQQSLRVSAATAIGSFF
jgi:hypothetical protein